MTDTERLQHIAAIAHMGGLDHVSTEYALTMIRRLTLSQFAQISNDRTKPAVRRVVEACRAARAEAKLGGEG